MYELHNKTKRKVSFYYCVYVCVWGCSLLLYTGTLLKLIFSSSLPATRMCLCSLFMRMRKVAANMYAYFMTVVTSSLCNGTYTDNRQGGGHSVLSTLQCNWLLSKHRHPNADFLTFAFQRTQYYHCYIYVRIAQLIY